jgi:hypothetical protein
MLYLALLTRVVRVDVMSAVDKWTGGRAKQVKSINVLYVLWSGLQDCLNVRDPDDASNAWIHFLFLFPCRHGVLVAVTWAANQVIVPSGGLCDWLGRRSTQGRVGG